LSDQIHSFLDGISLGSLVDEEHVKQVSERQTKELLEKELSGNPEDSLQAVTGM
jgi:hypothetical protein